MVYYIAEDIRKRNTAGAKAPDDILELCRKRGYTEFSMPMFPEKKSRLYQKLWLFTICIRRWSQLEKLLKDGDIVIYQHPMYGNRIIAHMVPRIRSKKDCRFVALIHDLESLRKGITGVIQNSERTNEIADNQVLKGFDYVICHNEHMRQYLIGQNFKAEKLINLEIFDYLSDCRRHQPPKEDKPSIAIAGNLAAGKCGYIYDICRDGNNSSLKINLYGNNYDEAKASEQMEWHGSFKPEELPDHLTGDFGLVWDGESAETCKGNTGNYLRYNNPHKTSLYLSSGMPVIVWREAAIADFVLENRVGIAVDNLYGLDDTISSLADEEYREMCENIQKIAEKLHNGAFFYHALDAIIHNEKTEKE